ncbi:MAG: RidA family protein [Acidimicrobiia bacterium]
MPDEPTTAIAVPEIAPPTGSYSHAIRSGSGTGLLFVSGQIPIDSAGSLVGRQDPEAQCEQVFRNLSAVLKRGGSSLEYVLKLGVFMVCAIISQPSLPPVLAS